MFHKCFHRNVILSNLSIRFCSSRLNESSHLKPNLDRPPELFQLEHVKQRLSYTTPLMFRNKLDFTFYHKSVILDDKIFNVKKYGLQSFISYISILSVVGQILYPHIHTEVISVVPAPAEGAVHLKWRICYISWLHLLFNYKYFKFDYRIKNLKWYDGLSVFTVDGDGLVYNVTLEKIDREIKFLNGPFEKLKSKIYKPVLEV